MCRRSRQVVSSPAILVARPDSISFFVRSYPISKDLIFPLFGPHLAEILRNFRVLVGWGAGVRNLLLFDGAPKGTFPSGKMRG